MTPLDLGSTMLLLLGAALMGALIGAALLWRTLQAEAGALPVWQLLRRAGIELEGRRLREAEVRCSLCAWQRQCRRVTAAGEDVPGDCPNASLFAVSPPRA